MNEQNQALVNEIGIDIVPAMERFMDNEGLYFKFLMKITENEQFGELTEQLANSQWADALMTSHNLKSLTGNLSLTKLHSLLSEQVRLLREDKREKAVAIMDDITAEFHRIVDLLNNSGLPH